MSWSTPATWSTSQVVTAAEMNQEVRDNLTAAFPDDVATDSFTPTLKGTSGDPGTSGTTGAYWRVGPIRFFWVTWVLSSGGSGDYYFALPDTAVNISYSTSGGIGTRIGGFHMRDLSPAFMIEGSVLLRSATSAHFHAASAVAGDATGSGVVSHDNPRTWASGDVLSCYGQYPIA